MTSPDPAYFCEPYPSCRTKGGRQERYDVFWQIFSPLVVVAFLV